MFLYSEKITRNVRMPEMSFQQTPKWFPSGSSGKKITDGQKNMDKGSFR